MHFKKKYPEKTFLLIVEDSLIFSMAKGHTHSVQSVSVHEKIMVTGSSDRTIRVWDLTDNKEVSLSLSL